MKKKMFAFLMIALAVGGLSAQDTTKKTKIYRTWISTNSEPFKVKGSLYKVNDSSVFVSNSLRLLDYPANRDQLVELHLENINTIKIRRMNNIGKGALIGAISGFVVGGLIGYASGDDPPCTPPPGAWFCWTTTAEEKAVNLGVPLSIVGAGLGALIGSAKIVIPINGNAYNFNKNKNELRKYSIIN